jgi:large subunit ribosomal protein L6
VDGFCPSAAGHPWRFGAGTSPRRDYGPSSIGNKNMSRIGKKHIPIPAGVQITLEGNSVKVTGKKGELSYTFSPLITVKQEDGHLVVTRPNDEGKVRALHGTTRALISNMVIGVSQGFTRILEIEGVGYRAEVKEGVLILNLGYSHDIRVQPTQTLSFVVPPESKGRQIVINGIDKQEVGETAAYIRKQRPPEPYLGKGIRYSDEKIRRKEGKSGKGK